MFEILSYLISREYSTRAQMHDTMAYIKAMERLKHYTYSLLRKSEKYTKTDMVYLVKSGFWMNLSYISNSIFAFLLTVAFAKLLSKEVFGTYQFILSIGTMIGSLTLTGMNNAVIQAVARGYEGTVKRSIPVQLKYNIVATIAALGVAIYYWMNSNQQLALGILVIGILTPVFNTYNTYTALLTGKKDFYSGFKFSLALNLPYFITMGSCLFFLNDPLMLVLINLGVNTLVTFILYKVAIRIYRPNDQHDPSAISLGKHLSIAGIISAIANQADTVLIFHYLGTVPLAIYAFASTIPEKAYGILKSVSMMAFPKLSERSHAELKSTVVSKSMRLAGLNIMMSAIYIACAPLIFYIFFPNYSSAIIYSQGYACALIFSTLTNMSVTVLTAMQATKEIYAYNIVSPIINISLMAGLIMPLGLWGLILARGIGGALSFIFSLILIKYKKIV